MLEYGLHISSNSVMCWNFHSRAGWLQQQSEALFILSEIGVFFLVAVCIHHIQNASYSSYGSVNKSISNNKLNTQKWWGLDLIFCPLESNVHAFCAIFDANKTCSQSLLWHLEKQTTESSFLKRLQRASLSIRLSVSLSACLCVAEKDQMSRAVMWSGAGPQTLSQSALTSVSV